jgi:hypothetical protein
MFRLRRLRLATLLLAPWAAVGVGCSVPQIDYYDAATAPADGPAGDGGGPMFCPNYPNQPIPPDGGCCQGHGGSYTGPCLGDCTNPNACGNCMGCTQVCCASGSTGTCLPHC